MCKTYLLIWRLIKFIRLKKWVTSSHTKADSKCIFLQVESKVPLIIQPLYLILLLEDSNALHQALLTQIGNNSGSSKRSNGCCTCHPLPELADLLALKEGEPDKQKINGKMAYYCELRKTWSYVCQHASITYC